MPLITLKSTKFDFKKTAKTSIKILIKTLNFLAIFITILLHFLAEWLKETFNNVPFNDILFNIFMPIKGTEQNLINQFFLKCLLPSIFIATPIFFIFNKIIKLTKNKNNVLSYKLFKENNFINLTVENKTLVLEFMLFKKSIELKIKRILIYFSIILIEFFCIATSLHSCYKALKIDDFIKANKESSYFIKKHYVDPKKIKLTFPQKKRNLIYIFAESLESSFFSKELGGNEKFNLMKPLTKLTLKNLNFSNSEQIGGACSSFGSTFTTAGIISQTMGIPLKIQPKIVNLKQNHAYFFNNVYGLGNILEKAGYNQIFLIGSDKKFGNRDILMQSHGNYKIYDYYSAIQENKIDKNYKVWWGLEDSKLFKIAKEKILNLSKKDRPFNFTILTTNTHCPEGFLENHCEPKFEDKYSNAVYYSAKQIKAFIEWIQKQPFFKNTTVIVAGDHLSMAHKHFVNYKNKFNRTIFNLFINSNAKPKKTINRIFTSLDMFPTTLASLGVKIKGNRLGLGTNLFSDKKTLAEIFGIDYINKEFKKHSSFYDINFIYKK